MLDNPNGTLYWCLQYGQRRQIAHEFGVVKRADRQLGELPASRLWLRRLRACGSIAPAMIRARQLHLHELRRIENIIRQAGVRGWRDELERWRDHKFRLLELVPESNYAVTGPA